MKSVILWSLVLLNAVLLMAFLDRVTHPQFASAQVRRSGDYLLISGDVQGQPTSLVYVLDQSNGLLGAMSYDDSSHKLGVMPSSIDIAAVFQEAMNSTTPPVRTR